MPGQFTPRLWLPLLLLSLTRLHVSSLRNQAEYTVRLEGETLHTHLSVTNTGDKAFDFTASLHRCDASLLRLGWLEAGRQAGRPGRGVTATIQAPRLGFISSLHPGKGMLLCGGHARTAMRQQKYATSVFSLHHSYFGIEDIETANVRGLQGLEYLDRVGFKAL